MMFPLFMYSTAADVSQPILAPMTNERIFPAKNAKDFNATEIKQSNSKSVYMYNAAAAEVPQPMLMPKPNEKFCSAKNAKYFISNELKKLNSKPKSALKMHNVAHGGQKENKSDSTEIPQIKVNTTFVSPKPIINHDFKKKVDLAKKRNRKLKEAARNFVVPDLFEQKPKSFEQRKTENLEWLTFFYELDQERVIVNPTLSEWVIAKKAEELAFEREKAKHEENEWRINWRICQDCADYWDEQFSRILKQKTEHEEKLAELIGMGLFAEAQYKSIFKLKNKKPKSFKRLVQLELDDLYEKTHNMRDVVNAFNQRNR